MSLPDTPLLDMPIHIIQTQVRNVNNFPVLPCNSARQIPNGDTYNTLNILFVFNYGSLYILVNHYLFKNDLNVVLEANSVFSVRKI